MTYIGAQSLQPPNSSATVRPSFFPLISQHLYIDPDECIDCALCEPECPTEAIWADDELPSEQIPFIEINEKGAELYRDKNITEQKEPMAHESPYSIEDAIKVVQID